MGASISTASSPASRTAMEPWKRDPAAVEAASLTTHGAIWREAGTCIQVAASFVRAERRKSELRSAV